MKCKALPYCIIAIAINLWIAPLSGFSAQPDRAAAKYKTISAISCDSLIKANVENPNFVILDVRTPDIWKADHLQGAINRNYYDADFDAQLKALPKNKIFLLHCQSGGRSAPTLQKMKNLNFAEVYEMSGGINSWNSLALPTTGILAPKLMLVSNGGTKNGTLTYGIADTLKVTVTNRGNDVLTFGQLTFPQGNEFSCNLDLNKKLTGSEDYTFSVFYKPLLTYRELVTISIAGNGGTLNLIVSLKKGTVQGITPLGVQQEPEIYPNPARDFISFRGIPETVLKEVSLVNINGRLVKQLLNHPATEPIDLTDLEHGIYLVRLVTADSTVYRKLIIRN
jgi:rhodanese-related sulfurtransferase